MQNQRVSSLSFFAGLTDVEWNGCDQMKCQSCFITKQKSYINVGCWMNVGPTVGLTKAKLVNRLINTEPLLQSVIVN